MKPKRLQWHPGFFAVLQIEFCEEWKKLVFENEHQLSKKPMAIDVLVIVVNPKERIEKNIGRIFRQHNIVEYKEPDDYVSLNDFYKVTGYACFYQADTEKIGEIPPEEITLTFVSNHYPEALIAYLKKYYQIRVEAVSDGINYLHGWIFPVQIITNGKLPPEENVWLSRLRKNLDMRKDLEPLAKAYRKKRNQPLYSAAMDLILRANPEQSEEGKQMCDAIRELFAEELEEGERRGERRGALKGIRLAKSIITLSGEGYQVSEIAERLQVSEELVRSALE